MNWKKINDLFIKCLADTFVDFDDRIETLETETQIKYVKKRVAQEFKKHNITIDPKEFIKFLEEFIDQDANIIYIKEFVVTEKKVEVKIGSELKELVKEAVDGYAYHIWRNPELRKKYEDIYEYAFNIALEEVKKLKLMRKSGVVNG